MMAEKSRDWLIGKKRKDLLARRSPHAAQHPARAAVNWPVRGAILGALFLAVGLVWHFWLGQEPRALTELSPTQRGAPEVGVATPEPESETKASQAAPGPEPLAQAATLKAGAVEVARAVVKTYPEAALSYALLGSAFYNLGQSKEAEESLRHCLELDPGQVDAYDMLARMAYEKGELEAAVRLSEAGLQQGRANPEMLLRLGRAKLDLGQSGAAIEALQAALRLPGATSETHYLLGQAYLQAGDYTQAKESFAGAIALLPDHTQAYFGLFTACTRLKQPEEAARYREQFLRLEAIDRQTLTDRSAREDTLTGLPLVRRTVARTYFGAGQIYLMHQEAEKAERLFFETATLDPENAPARAAIEASYAQRGALAEAVKVFAQLTVDQPENALNYLFLGRIHDRRQQFEASEQAYQKVAELAPDRTEGYRALIELYLRSSRKPREAQALAERLLQLESSGPNYYLLAFACVKNNDRAGALAAAEQAVALSPENPRFREFLEKLRAAP